jgi:hypothetical protein
MKLMSSPPNYNQPRLQTSVATLPSARLANAHTPQAEAQRSGAAWYRRLELGFFPAGLGFLLSFTPSLGVSFDRADRLDRLYWLITENCSQSLPILNKYLKTATQAERATTAEVVSRIQEKCPSDSYPIF